MWVNGHEETSGRVSTLFFENEPNNAVIGLQTKFCCRSFVHVLAICMIYYCYLFKLQMGFYPVAVMQ
jgi:hypothetical protein